MDTDVKRLGRYELQEMLGRGGMGEVWKAFDTQLQRSVAIKWLATHLQDDSNSIVRFQQEAQMIAALHHSNIVQIYDFQSIQHLERTDFYMIMEYVEGETLAHYLHAISLQGRYPPAIDIIHLFKCVGLAIDYAHQQGLLHRDIKPSNILLDQRYLTRSSLGNAVLTDFGIAKLLDTSHNTASGYWLGTPHYTSPEQAEGDPCTALSDLYALGVILYQICTGVLPFDGKSLAVILTQHLSATPPLPSLLNPAIPPALNAVILRSLAKDPAERFPNAKALTIALAEALSCPIPNELIANDPITTRPLLPLISSSHSRPPVSLNQETIAADPTSPLTPGESRSRYQSAVEVKYDIDAVLLKLSDISAELSESFNLPDTPREEEATSASHPSLVARSVAFLQRCLTSPEREAIATIRSQRPAMTYLTPKTSARPGQLRMTRALYGSKQYRRTGRRILLLVSVLIALFVLMSFALSMIISIAIHIQITR